VFKTYLFPINVSIFDLNFLRYYFRLPLFVLLFTKINIQKNELLFAYGTAIMRRCTVSRIIKTTRAHDFHLENPYTGNGSNKRKRSIGCNIHFEYCITLTNISVRNLNKIRSIREIIVIILQLRILIQHILDSSTYQVLVLFLFSMITVSI